jgi:hypothetical protein
VVHVSLLNKHVPPSVLVSDDQELEASTTLLLPSEVESASSPIWGHAGSQGGILSWMTTWAWW